MEKLSKNNFWKKLAKPSLVLAPMEDITDPAFRRIVAKYGRPDVIFTEFASVDGLVSKAGREKIKKDLIFDQIEHPIVAQLFGSDPAKFKEAAAIIEQLGFDGVDINMGCPDKNVIKNGAGAALIKNQELAKQIIRSTKAGVRKIPVSVKTRIGFDSDICEQWIPTLLEENPAAISIHARTKKEMWKVPNHWETFRSLQKYFIGRDTVLIGNGDIGSYSEAKERASQYNLDGIMIGRAVLGNPWIFNSKIKKENLKIEKILATIIEHSKLFEKLLGQTRNFRQMYKHFSMYLKGYPETKELKTALMQTTNSKEVEATVHKYLADMK